MQQQVQLKIAVVNEKIKRLEQQLQDAPVTEKKVVLQRRLPVEMELTALLEEQALLTQQQIGMHAYDNCKIRSPADDVVDLWNGAVRYFRSLSRQYVTPSKAEGHFKAL